MNRQEFSGKTLDEALINAARSLGTEVSLLSYNILPQASGGLLSKLFQRGVRVEAWVDSANDVQAAAREAVRQAMADTQSPAAPGRLSDRDNKNKSRQQRTPRNEHPAKRQQRGSEGVEAGPNPRPTRQINAVEPQDINSSTAQDAATERVLRPKFPLNSEQAKVLLTELGTEFIKGFDPAAEQAVQLDFTNDDEVIVSVKSQMLEETLVKSDRLSCAFEHLFKRISQKRFGDVSGRVTFNAGNALELREEKLKEMALSIAAKVKDTGKTVTLSSKSSQERRVIHLALENMEGIGTKSVGIGDSRKLIVFSTDKAHRRSQNSRRRQQRSRQQNHLDGTGPSLDTSAEMSSDQSQQGRRPSRRRGRRGGNANRPQSQGSSPSESTQQERDPDSHAMATEV